ncbi:putative heme-binding domain-containing protein [Cyclobacterium xiamenense]|uniref:Putative heme-binding domain-containing protein n=1 Tax=Cyclobacterium xiamenense TaxID=1297121 RepID=A0A1H7BCD2_9BACT|nr:putative heme-binding domain-containing protein [Cyclobacterium xiamenense]
MKGNFIFVVALLAAMACKPEKKVELIESTTSASLDSLSQALGWPEELAVQAFSGPELTPSPACLAVSPYGEVYVGVDAIGSLGKTPGKGRIVKLIDRDNDGKADEHTVFAAVDNPRGIIPIGDKLYVLHTQFSLEDSLATGMDLVVFEDKDGDGMADGPSAPLIQHISSPKFLQGRGTDHATNGIRLGIDGWIYIAVGDFGFHGAVDRDGTEMTMLGGGILRVRPDGTEMEVYTHGLRNIYDVAIDPYMNVFTRGNTNDGGGWNIRFIHQIQSGEYGYPVLFKNFTEEIIPALVDVGGGSGTGALFMDDYRWPEKFNQVPMMADWGRSQVYIHRVTADGPSYTQEEEEFFKLPQVTDLDMDGTGRMFMAAWDGAGYSGNEQKGYVVRVVPKTWEYSEMPDLETLDTDDLVDLLGERSATIRLYAQQELIARDSDEAADEALRLAKKAGEPLYARVAAMYAYAQLRGTAGLDNLLPLMEDTEMKEHVIRAVTDRAAYVAGLPVEPFIEAMGDPSPRVQAAAIIALGRIGKKEAVPHLLEVAVPDSFQAPKFGEEGPHAQPNAAIILPHLAVRSLVKLEADEPCLQAVGTANSELALWALRYMHTQDAVSGLISRYNGAGTEQIELKQGILSTLARLYTKEAPYDGSWWWGTRPDTHGPYYKSVLWAASPEIKSLFQQLWNNGSQSDKDYIAMLNQKNRMGILEFGGDYAVTEVLEEPGVDLEKIKNQKGQIGASSIEDILLAMQEIPGEAVKGKAIFEQQGCKACHSIAPGEQMKGPYMGQIGSIMSREQIAESILKPDASISQGFATVMIQTKDDKTYVGFVTEESATRIVIRNIAGQAFTLAADNVMKRTEMENSMMPAGLANSLSYEEFASLITFLSEQK